MKKIDYSSLIVAILILYFTLSNFSRLIPAIGFYYQLLIIILVVIQFKIMNDWVDRKIIIFVLGIFSFQLLFILYGTIINNGDIIVALYNSKYLLIFILMPIFLYIIKEKKLKLFLKYLSLSMLFKICIIVMISMDLSFGKHISENYMINNSHLLVHPYMGVYRVFDSYLVLFPLAFYAILKLKMYYQILFQIIILLYIIFSFAVGMYFIYIFIGLFFISRKYFYLIFFILLIYFFYDYTFISEFIYKLYESKLTNSIGVKSNQIFWIKDNISLFGQGLGYSFNINGRIDTMLENLHIYWIATYGIVGVSILYFFILVMPIYIYIKFKNIFEIKIIFMSFLSALLASIVNPYALSGVIFMFLALLISCLFNDMNFYKKSMVSTQGIVNLKI